MTEEENIEEIIDEAEDQYEDGQDISEGQMDQFDGAGFSVQKEKSDLFNWFWRVVQLGQPKFDDDGLAEEALKLSKVGNLDKAEIGMHTISIRDSLILANLGDTFHHKKFGNFWRKVGMINVSTSMSKKGWLIEQSISQKKVRERTKAAPTPAIKSRIFGKKKEDSNSPQP